jgi:hypothetical protein
LRFCWGRRGGGLVTAFLLALAVRISVRFEGMVSKLMAQFSRRETVVMAVLVALGPLFLLASVDDPLWCQRSQSAYYIVLGAMFLSDMLANATTWPPFWPGPRWRPRR